MVQRMFHVVVVFWFVLSFGWIVHVWTGAGALYGSLRGLNSQQIGHFQVQVMEKEE